LGRRSRRQHQPRLRAPGSDYCDPEGNVLTLRGSLSAGARGEYARVLAGEGMSAAATQDDAWQRALELLFERLASRWVIAGAPIERPRELLERFRAASPGERAWVREVVREHCTEHFPELAAP
jgi:hypothetical protein